MERIVDDKVKPIREEIRKLRTEMRQGFADVNKSIKVLAGEIAELKVREEDQKHEERISRLEERVWLRGKTG